MEGITAESMEESMEMARSTRTGLWAALLIAAVAVACSMLTSAGSTADLRDVVFVTGIFGGIFLGARYTGSLLSRSRIASATLRSVIVAVAALAAGYAMFVVIAFVVFAVVTSTK
jgi:hypothetical protein